MQGLDNTAADGSCAFQVLDDIFQQLVQLGVERAWSQSITESLNKAKQYLKTNYKVNCQEQDSQCADLRIECEHNHSLICESCNNLNITTNNLRRKINDAPCLILSNLSARNIFVTT